MCDLGKLRDLSEPQVFRGMAPGLFGMSPHQPSQGLITVVRTDSSALCLLCYHQNELLVCQHRLGSWEYCRPY